MSYGSDQEQFLKERGIGIESHVRIERSAQTGEGGWKQSWVSGMENLVGKVYQVKDISPGEGIYLSNGYWVPFFVLNKGEYTEWEDLLSTYPVLSFYDLDDGEKFILMKLCSRYHFADEELSQVVGVASLANLGRGRGRGRKKEGLHGLT